MSAPTYAENQRASKPLESSEGRARGVRFPCSTEGLSDPVGIASDKIQQSSPRNPPENLPEVWPTVPWPKAGGGVYFIQAPDGLIKIGRTKHLEQRFAQLEREFGAGLRLVGMIPKVGNAVEKALHRRLSKHRSHREWFRAHADLRQMLEVCVGAHDLEHLDAAIERGAETAAAAREISDFIKDARALFAAREGRVQQEHRRKWKAWARSAEVGETIRANVSIPVPPDHWPNRRDCPCGLCAILENRAWFPVSVTDHGEPSDTAEAA